MERFSTDKHRTVTPEMVVEILGRHGQGVSVERAAAILELMYELSWHSVALEIELAKSTFSKGRKKCTNLNHKLYQRRSYELNLRASANEESFTN